MSQINRCRCGRDPSAEVGTGSGIIMAEIRCACGSGIRNASVASCTTEEEALADVTKTWNANHQVPATEKVAADTRRFAIHSTLVNHCGRQLTPDLIDQITNEIVTEMTEGGCAWSFKEA